jgi:hypothetical protein
MDTIINKVSESGLLTIDPADFYTPGERAVIDLKPLLVEEFLLREKDFREYVKGTDWSKYQNSFVAIHCSNDAIIPVWAYMLLTVALEPYAAGIFYGAAAEMEQMIFKQKLMQFDPRDFSVIKELLSRVVAIFMFRNQYIWNLQEYCVL